MMLKKGTTRIVLLLPKLGIVVKFPKFRIKIFVEDFFRMVLILYKFFFDKNLTEGQKNAVINMLNLYFCGHTYQPYSGAWYLFIGIRENWRELVFFRANKENSFLLPTFFSFFGLFNICPFVDTLENNFDSVIQKELFYTVEGYKIFNDGHHFDEGKNFCFYNGTLRIIDYGGYKTEIIISEHLSQLDELSKKFGKT